MERARHALDQRLAERRGGGPGGGVLLVVGADAVPVLEVDAQVLDGFVVELAEHPFEEVLVAADHLQEVGGPADHAGLGGAAVLMDGVRLELVGRNIDRVHRLATLTIPRVALAERGVGLGQVLVEVGDQAGDVHSGTLG